MNDNERYIVDNYFGFESKQLLSWSHDQVKYLFLSSFWHIFLNHKVIITIIINNPQGNANCVEFR